MNISTIISFAQYNYASHRRLWNSIDHITDAQFVEDVPYSIGSLRNHYVHLVGVDGRWLARLQGVPLPVAPQADTLTTRAAVRPLWDKVEAAMLAYLPTLTDAHLAEVLTYDMPHRGGIKHNTRGEILLHLVNHGTDHRSQMLPILHRMGAPTFEQDYILHLYDS